MREYEKENVIKADFVTSFRDLKAFQVAYTLSLELHKASLEFPKIEQYALASQLRRSSKSICANIAEGFAKQRHSKVEFRRFIMMSLGSCDEVSLWLDYCRDLSYIGAPQWENWQDQTRHIEKMLHKLRQKLED